MTIRLVLRRLARPLERLHRDERGLVIGFFIRLALAVALLGLVVEEGGQVVFAQIRAESAARAAAQAAADTYYRATKSGSPDAVAAQAAREAAAEAAWAKDQAAEVESVAVTTDGIATVTVKETAHTVVIERLSFLKHFGVQRATEKEHYQI